MKHSDLESVVTVRAPDGQTTALSSRDLRNATIDVKRNAQIGQRDRFEILKERPLLFKGEMVQAILNDRKTQTRRVKGLDTINQWRSPNEFELIEVKVEPKNVVSGDLVSTAKFRFLPTGGWDVTAIPCPYGKPGDFLWVRETWRPALSDSHECYAYKADMKYRCNKPMPGDWESMTAINWGWKPSIHMPRKASRILLEITNIRVERLQSISEQDAISEGICQMSSGYWTGGAHRVKGTPKHMPSPMEGFKDLWDSINGATYPWHLNPWVWIVEFKRVGNAD